MLGKLLQCVILLSVAGAVAAEQKVPATFLPAANARMQKALETPVTGDFHNERVAVVFGKLFAQLPANLAFKSEKAAPVTFTGRFDGVPFRTALFRVAKATGYAVEWTKREDGALLISVHD